MSYLLDSDVVINYLAGREATTSLVDSLRQHGLSISVITLMEVVEGIEAGRTPAVARRGMRRLFRRTRLVVVSRAIAIRAADLRIELRRQKRQVNQRSLDLIVAATAIEHGLMLLTHNMGDYEDIPRLHIFKEHSPAI